MLKKASLFLWGFVIIYIVFAMMLAGLGDKASLSMADAFGSVFFGAIGLQILMSLTIPFFDKK